MDFLRCATIALIVSLATLGGVGVSYGGQDQGPTPTGDMSRWHSSDHARVRLIRGGLTDDGQDLAGLEIEMDEGWHTYWRSPGALGLPPTFNWRGSENVRGVEVRWPLPQHIVDGDYEAYGYEDRLVLPLIVARDDLALPAVLNLAIGYAVCETVCIPTLGFVSMVLPEREVAAEARPENTWAINAALARVPTHDLAAAGIEIDAARLVLSANAPRVLRISITSQTPFDDPHVILEGPKGTYFGTPKLRLDATGRHLEALIAVRRGANAATPFGRGLLLTLTGGSMAVEHSLVVTMAGRGPESSDD